MRYNSKLSEAPGFGQNIFEYAKRSNGAADYARLAERLSKGASEDMGKRRSVPEDLMGTILSESSEAADEDQAFRSLTSPGAVVSWDERPERVGITFNLSKQLGAELERLRLDLEEDVRPSRSEIAEAALRIAIEDVRERGQESELVKRLSGGTVDRATGVTVEGGRTTPAAWTNPAGSSRPPTTRTVKSWTRTWSAP